MAQDFLAAEYFFDNDPGAGNATPLVLGSTATPMTFTSSISIASLPPGFHMLCIRVKQSDGAWSLFESRGFMVSIIGANVVDISSAEYFFDNDPGEGNGTPISVPVGAASTFTVVTPTASLGTGFHFLAIRSKDLGGRWGIFESRGFYVTDATPDVSNITAAEYFFDTDPGIGNGTMLSIPTGAISNFTVSLPATGLPNGFHFLVVRTRNSEGHWGVFESRGFYVNNEPTAPINIIALEYFVDIDPGEGSGTRVDFPSPGPQVDEAFVFGLPNGLTAAAHTLGVRVLDDRGNWSFRELGTFNLAANEIPVAIAGSDQSITLPTNAVTLDGSLSSDADGSISYFYWTKISGPTPGEIISEFNPVTEVSNLVEGVYEFQLRVIDNVNVSGYDTVRVTVNNGSCPATPTIIHSGSTLSVADDPGATFQWFMNNVPVSGAINNTFDISLLEYGVYAVEVVKNGCTIRSNDYVYLITGSNSRDFTCKIFPNPSTGKFFVSVSNVSKQARVDVVDALGRVVYTSTLRSGMNVINEDVLAQGIYCVMINGKAIDKIEKR